MTGAQFLALYAPACFVIFVPVVLAQLRSEELENRRLRKAKRHAENAAKRTQFKLDMANHRLAMGQVLREIEKAGNDSALSQIQAQISAISGQLVRLSGKVKRS